MTWLVVYDIEDDRVRYKVADHCLDKGLERIQYSCFLGEMPDAIVVELEAQCRRRLGSKPGKIRMVPVCEKDLAKQKLIEVT